MIADIVYTVKEVTQHLKISRAQFYNLRRDGKIATKKLGAKTLVTDQELERFINQLPDGKLK